MQNYSSSRVSHPFQGFTWPQNRYAKLSCSLQEISRVEGDDQVGLSMVRGLQYELVIRVNQLWP